MWSVLLTCVVLSWSIGAENVTEEIRMPNVTADYDDAYLCHAKWIGNKTRFVTHLKPLDTAVTHHMLLFMCDEPGSDEDYWDCGEKADSKPVCKGSRTTVLFSWAMKAAEFSFPPDTSFPIGDSRVPYLVLQVHYKDASGFDKLPTKSDNSGWLISETTEPTKNVAGIYLFAANGYVGTGTTVLTIGCSFDGAIPIHPFAFRVHAHSHGKLNFAYVTHAGRTQRIGEKSPQEDQTYYAVKNKSLVIYPGDYLSAYCVMVNNDGRVIPIGSTRQDEMCNFYLMYSVPLEHMNELYQSNNECSQFNDNIPSAEEPFRGMWPLKFSEMPTYDEIEDGVFEHADY